MQSFKFMKFSGIYSKPGLQLQKETISSMKIHSQLGGLAIAQYTKGGDIIKQV